MPTKLRGNDCETGLNAHLTNHQFFTIPIWIQPDVEWFVYQKKIGSSIAPEILNITAVDGIQILLFGGMPFILPNYAHIHSILSDLKSIHIDTNIEIILPYAIDQEYYIIITSNDESL